MSRWARRKRILADVVTMMVGPIGMALGGLALARARRIG